MTTFTARTDRSLVRAGARSTRYVLLEAAAPKKRAVKQPKRPPVNVAFVLDRSGSMAGTKLALVDSRPAHSSWVTPPGATC